MKLLLPILALLLFTPGCKKYEAEYAVNCQFPAIFSFETIRTLLVTNADGELLQKFDIPQGATSLNESFSATGKDLSESYDLHYLVSPDSSKQQVYIYSHLDVPNGASVYFSSGYDAPQNLSYITFKIEGVESFDSIRVVSNGYYFSPEFDASTKIVTFSGNLPTNHGALVRLWANGESALRQLYVPNNLIADTVKAAWQDFKPESNPRSIELPGNYWIQNLEVTAISPGFDEFVTLEIQNVWQNNTQTISPQFQVPEGLPGNVAFRIRAESAEAIFEKIFQPGEPLRFDPADMEIGNFVFSGNYLNVEASGDIDLLRVESYNFYPNDTYLQWSISGATGSFWGRTLPELNAYLPDWYSSAPAFAFKKAGALQFDKYEYPQIREGFPYKLTEPYSVARGGYRSIWKFE
jgi:hypothetical protein